MKGFEDRWAITRSRGKAKYIFTYGLLYWGFPMALVMSLYLHYRGNLPWLPTLYFTIPIPLVLGVIWSILLWIFLENRYKQTK